MGGTTKIKLRPIRDGVFLFYGKKPGFSQNVVPEA
jgi:hypothetical protein